MRQAASRGPRQKKAREPGLWIAEDEVSDRLKTYQRWVPSILGHGKAQNYSVKILPLLGLTGRLMNRQ